MQRVVHNVILFGESGSGKSSVVNMIVGHDVAKVSSDPTGCTFKHQDYEASFDGFSCNIYDTAGLNEGDQGRVPHWKAIHQLYTLIRKLDGVTVLICCVRGRIKENTHANWTLFNDVICGGHVPVILVVTGLEQEDDWDDDSRISRIKAAFGVYGMAPKDIAPVVAIRGLRNDEMYEKSQVRLRKLISTHRRPWSTDKDTWFKDIYVRVYSETFLLSWFGVGTKVEFGEQMRAIFQRIAGQPGMKEGELRKLEEIFLAAERKIAKQESGFASKFRGLVKWKDNPTPAVRGMSDNRDESEQQGTSAAANRGNQDEQQSKNVQDPSPSVATDPGQEKSAHAPEMVHDERNDRDSEIGGWSQANASPVPGQHAFQAEGNDREKGEAKRKRFAKASLEGSFSSKDKEVESKRSKPPFHMGGNTNKDTPNVIIFGQTGAGKSSLINLLGGSPLAQVSSGQNAATSSNIPYVITPPDAPGKAYTFWDTPGLNEGERGTLPPRYAWDNLLKLTRETSINLLIYCVRAGRLPDILRVNYHLFWKIICDEKVPIVLVITGLEGEERPNDWWDRNAIHFEKWRMGFSGQACVTTLKGEAYQRSKQEVWGLVQRHCAPAPYCPRQSDDIWPRMDAYMDKGGGKSGRRCIIF